MSTQKKFTTIAVGESFHERLSTGKPDGVSFEYWIKKHLDADALGTAGDAAGE